MRQQRKRIAYIFAFAELKRHNNISVCIWVNRGVTFKNRPSLDYIDSYMKVAYTSMNDFSPNSTWIIKCYPCSFILSNIPLLVILLYNFAVSWDLKWSQICQSSRKNSESLGILWASPIQTYKYYLLLLLFLIYVGVSSVRCVIRVGLFSVSLVKWNVHAEEINGRATS